MTPTGSNPLFVDTGAFYAQFDANATRHDRADAVFTNIGTGDTPYRRVYTSSYILDELATLVLNHRTHSDAVAALERIRSSTVEVIHPDQTDFETAYDQFERFDDHDISFTDHMSGILASNRDIDHVFTFDEDHFRTLGFAVVPGDTGEA